MAKKVRRRPAEVKPDVAPRRAEGGEARRGGVLVRDSAGNRHPFLRGMVTHDLVQRGLPFEDAYAAAQAIRDRLSEREEITTAELKAVIESQLEEMLGRQRLAQLSLSDWAVKPDLEVVYHGERQPFSRGLLARSLQAAGVDLDRAYRLVAELQAQLRGEGSGSLSSDEVAQRVGELLEAREGVTAAARYRLVRRIHRLPRPLVIYLGGATGTGKSTLALEIAPLLRIYRITATDTIRQVMRMLFSPAILPAIHTSSFEVAARFDHPALDAGDGEADFDELLTATFREQATRICVGVRAVVERAILENMSVVVEGVHLAPPLVPFPDLEGAVHQVSLTLTTLSEETHRSRFLARSRTSARAAERYLQHFPAIRALQEYLIEQAESYEIPLFDTSDGETALPRALRLVTGLLQEKLPWLGSADEVPQREAVPTLLLAIDGMGDHPTRALGGRTPLAAANTPALDRLAREGQTGLADPVAAGVVPDTASGTLALFGQSPLAMKRGPVEALGTTLELAPGDVALRGNFATLGEDGRVIDRRAGRIRDHAAELAAALDRLRVPGSEFEDVEVRVQPTTEHRLAVVLRGPALSSAIQGSDPGDGAPPGPPLTPRPVDPRDERAVRTARILALFEEEARRVLTAHPINAQRRAEGLPAANAVLTRGAGRVHHLPRLERWGIPLRHACVSGDKTILGLATWLGAEAISSPDMTASLDTDLEAKFRAAREALETNDLVFLHVKGADIAAHDQRPDLKVQFLERVDRWLGWLVGDHPGPLRIAVASDHATLSEGGQHAADPVPVLIWGSGIEGDGVGRFDEAAAAEGALHRFPLQLLLNRLFELA
jgi:2,3-bisphosphoglycerate-independent phosphoglycerate mutase